MHVYNLRHFIRNNKYGVDMKSGNNMYGIDLKLEKKYKYMIILTMMIAWYIIHIDFTTLV